MERQSLLRSGILEKEMNREPQAQEAFPGAWGRAEA